MTERVDIAALKAHAAKGWGTDALIPKSVIELLCAELQAARATPADHSVPVAEWVEWAKLLATVVLNYPDFDCDNEDEPRPICKMARDLLVAPQPPQNAADHIEAQSVPLTMTDEMRSFIEGMSVSIDVSTDDHDAGNRYFGTVTEVMDDSGDKHGVTLLVQSDVRANFEPQAEAPKKDGDLMRVMERRKIAAEIRAEYLAAVELTPVQIYDGWQQTFSTNNPFCPCDLKSFTKAVRWAEHAVNKAHTK